MQATAMIEGAEIAALEFALLAAVALRLGFITL
jgi:hypothetical protein